MTTATVERQPALLPIPEANELPDTDWGELTEGDRPMSDLATLDAPRAVAPQRIAPPVAQSDSHTLMAVIARAATDPSFDLAKIERLYAFKREYEKDEARKAFHEGMAAFKLNPPTILKTKHVAFQTSKGTTEYDHATLGGVVDAVAKALAQHGISASWDPRRQDGRVYVTCTLTHALGHSESVTLDGPLDDSGGKNAIQSLGSTVSYLQRYTLLAITGLATHDMDDDGRGAGGFDEGWAEQRGTERTVTRDEQRTPPPADTYPGADFDKNLPTWRRWIAAGRRTAEQVIETVESKAPLTDEQKARIRGTH